jgi:hypothetical protein
MRESKGRCLTTAKFAEDQSCDRIFTLYIGHLQSVHTTVEFVYYISL